MYSYWTFELSLLLRYRDKLSVNPWVLNDGKRLRKGQQSWKKGPDNHSLIQTLSHSCKGFNAVIYIQGWFSK